MKNLSKTSIQEEVKARQQRMEKIDGRVREFSKALIQEEVRNYQAFTDTEYFLKLSQPVFEKLSVPEQVLYLAFWYCERNRSLPQNKFSFECRKRIDGVNVDFLVSLETEKDNYKAAVECDANQEKRRQLENLGLPVFNFLEKDLWSRPLEVADEVFTYLDSQAERAHLQ